MSIYTLIDGTSYRHPPVHAVVLLSNEKSQILVLDHVSLACCSNPVSTAS